jgi:hypothetical protein
MLNLSNRKITTNNVTTAISEFTFGNARITGRRIRNKLNAWNINSSAQIEEENFLKYEKEGKVTELMIFNEDQMSSAVRLFVLTTNSPLSTKNGFGQFNIGDDYVIINVRGEFVILGNNKFYAKYLPKGEYTVEFVMLLEIVAEMNSSEHFSEEEILFATYSRIKLLSKDKGVNLKVKSLPSYILEAKQKIAKRDAAKTTAAFEAATLLDYEEIKAAKKAEKTAKKAAAKAAEEEDDDDDGLLDDEFDDYIIE